MAEGDGGERPARPSNADLGTAAFDLLDIARDYDAPVPAALRRVAAWLLAGAPDPDGAAAARQRVMVERWEGVHCPTCDQTARVYRRRLYGTQVRALARVDAYFARPDAEPWLHLQKYLAAWGDVASQGGDPIRLSYWGLLERQPGTRADTSVRLGYVRITELGQRFLRGEARVPAWLHFYNEAVVEPDPEHAAPLVTVADVVGESFDYAALIAAPGSADAR